LSLIRAQVSVEGFPHTCLTSAETSGIGQISPTETSRAAHIAASRPVCYFQGRKK